MKTFILGSLLFLTSLTAFAQPISLQPGSTAVINGDVVTCLGTSPDNLGPACSIKQDGSYYRLYAGLTVVESYYSFAEAIQGAKKMKDAGLCR